MRGNHLLREEATRSRKPFVLTRAKQQISILINDNQVCLTVLNAIRIAWVSAFYLRAEPNDTSKDIN